MRLTDRILSFTLLGSEWVLWVLVGLSILSVGVMVERALFFSSKGKLDFETLGKELLRFLRVGDVAGARRALDGTRSPESQVAAAGLDQIGRGTDAVSEAMASTKSRLRMEMERNLGVLGTLGNNAPFIGLFGTVLGIIKAFADLSHNQGGGAAAVMSGISAALVATAVGLMVAIPAVIAFNHFQNRVRRAIGRVDSIAHLILSATANAKMNDAPAAAPAGGE
jgi:biopolymer transport protein ExbB